MKPTLHSLFLILVLLITSLPNVDCSKKIFPKSNSNKTNSNFDSQLKVLNDSAAALYNIISIDFCADNEIPFKVINIYKKIITESESPEIRTSLGDRIMNIYENLINCYKADSIYLLNRQAYDGYIIFRNEEDKYERIYELFTNAFTADNNSFSDFNILPYLDLGRRYQISSSRYLEEDFLELYEKLSNQIEYRKSHGGDEKKMNELQEKLSILLPLGPKIDCDFVRKRLLPKLSTDYWNEELADNVKKLVVQCNPRDTAFIRNVQSQLEIFGYTEQSKSLKEYLLQFQ